MGAIEVLEPVLNNDNEPCWLVSKGYKKVSKTTTNKPLKEAAKDKTPLEEVMEYGLQPNAVWQCGKCGATTQSNPDKPTYCEACDRNANFEQITEIINPELWKLPKWKDIPVEDIDMLGVYSDMLDLIKQLLVFADEIEYKIYTLWIISTWKLECWDTVGYPIFIGIPDSGKSRALRIISELGYRPIKATGIKQAAIPRLCHYWNVTLLIDEAHNKLNPKTAEGSGLLDFIKDSYKRGSTYVTCDNDNQKNVYVTKNFGFKAIAGEKSFKTGLLSRGIIFWMEKDDPEIAKISYVNDDIAALRTRLLNYRIKTSNPEDLGNDFCLKGRAREIFESVISTGHHIGIKVDDIIKYVKDRSKQEEEALQGSVQWEILKIIRDFEGDITLFPDDTPSKLKTDSILGSDGLNWLTGDKSEDHNSRMRFGYILRDMGLVTKREKDGRTLFLQEEPNNKRLIRLYRRYKL